MKCETFTMPDFLFDESSHTYSLDGQKLPSVTGILQDVGIVDYSHLPQAVRERALARGRAVHLATQYDDEFVFGFHAEPLDDESLAPDHVGYVQAWRKFRVESGFRPSLIEYRSFHPMHRYAGTLDRSGVFESRPNYRVLLDLKTGTAEPWVALQLAAYAGFFESPRAFLRVSVELHEDATYKVRTYSGAQWQTHFNEFLSCLSVYRIRRQYGSVAN